MAVKTSKHEHGAKGRGSLFSRIFRSATSGLRRSAETTEESPKMTEPSAAATPRATSQTNVAAPARRRPIQSDVSPIDEISPAQKGARGLFDERHHTDTGGEEFLANRNSDFNDEDHFTNKSGDPRIGTHGRKYEA